MRATLVILFLLAGCGEDAVGDYTTPRGMRVDTSRSRWLAPEAAALIERRFVAALVHDGVATEREADAALAQVDLVLEPDLEDEVFVRRCKDGETAAADGWCRERAKLGGQTWPFPDERGRVLVRLAPSWWCDYRSSLAHELAHVVTNVQGRMDASHERASLWGAVERVKLELWPRCFGL